MTARMSVRRLPPPGLVGGIKGSTYAHSSSVKSLGYLRWSRSYFARFSSVHIDGPPANQTTSFESYMIQSTQEVSKRTLSPISGQKFSQKRCSIGAAATLPPSGGREMQ